MIKQLSITKFVFVLAFLALLAGIAFAAFHVQGASLAGLPPCRTASLKCMPGANSEFAARRLPAQPLASLLDQLLAAAKRPAGQQPAALIDSAGGNETAFITTKPRCPCAN